jgi:hypothetical protein
MTVLLAVCALAGVLVWLAASPARLAALAIAAAVAHPSLAFSVTAGASRDYGGDRPAVMT